MFELGHCYITTLKTNSIKPDPICIYYAWGLALQTINHYRVGYLTVCLNLGVGTPILNPI